MEDDIDIYDDLPSFETKPNENSIGNNEKDIASEQIELKKQIAELTVKLENFQKVNENLESNLHSLLKTAKAEIARKDMVINDLRKKLDDITFRRGIYPKINEDVAHNSSTQNSVKNNYYKPIDSYFSRQEIKFETIVTDLQCNQVKEQQSKSTLAPITVFGERLRKRITDEQNLEKKEKLNSNNNNSTSSVKESTEKYIGESDKENGSFTSTNLCNTKNIQPSMVVQLTEQECTKSPLTTPKDSDLEDKSKIEQIPVASAKCTGKRALEETDEYVHAKRKKLDDDKRLTETVKRENNVHDVVDRIHDVSKYTTIESSSNISEKRNTPQSSDTGYAYDLSAKVKNYEPLIANDWNKKEEKKVPKKNSDTICDNRVINRRFSKRQNKSAENFTVRPDEKHTGDRSLETFKRDSHRNICEHRRIRQREDRYSASTVDHRSFRVREATSYAKCPEGKYSRDQYPKYTSYADRFEKHYDYRGHSADKSKAVNKELCSTRNIKKRVNIDRSSTNRKTDNLKKSNHYAEYEGRRLRSTDRMAKLEREKQNEFLQANIERPRERTKEHEISKRYGKKNNYSVIVQVERIDEKNNKELKPRKESEKRAKESEEKPVTNLKEGELADNPEKEDKRKKLKDEIIEEGNGELSDVSSSIDKDVKNKLVEEPKIPLDISEHPLTKQDQTESKNSPGSLEINESAENVENIEKFIRELAFNESAPEKNHETTSEMVRSNQDEKMPISEEGTEEKSKTNEKERPPGSENTCSSISEGKQLSENVDRVETQAKESNDEKVSLNGAILNSVDNHLLDKTTDIAGNRSKVNGQFETVAKEDLLLVLGSKSPCAPSTSPLESFRKMTSNGNKTIIKADDGKTIRSNKHLPNDRDDNKEQKINQNDLEASGNKEKEHLNTTAVTITKQKKKIGKRTVKAEEEEKNKGSKQLKKSPIRKRDDAKAKRASLNVQGKIVVFVNRKKPVCLADNNANMTVLINDKKHDDNVTNSSERITADNSTLQRNRSLKKARINDGEVRKTS